MAEKKKLPNLNSPKGSVLFPHVIGVDYGTDKYPDTKGSFNVTLALEPEDAERMRSMLAPTVAEARTFTDESFAKLKPQAKAKFKEPTFNEPGTDEYDKEGNPTGRSLFRFKTTAFFEKRDGSRVQRKVQLFDSMLQPVRLTDELGYGSVVKVAFFPAPYFVDGQGAGGVSLYLNAIQIIELRKTGERSASDYGFGEEDGFTGDCDDMADTLPSDAGPMTSTVDPDDVPF